jgi:DNA-directed RNA polymerase III subunit RPC3
MEERIMRCQLDPKIDDTDDLPDGPSVTTMELAAALSPTINVATGIGKVSTDRINTSHLKIDMSERNSKLKPEIDGNADGEDSGEENHDMNGNVNGNIPEVDEDFDSHGEDPFADEQIGKGPKQVVKGIKRAKVTFDEQTPMTASSEESRLLQLRNHLSLLAADDCRFLRRCGENGKGVWTVDFEPLVEHLKESEVNFIMREEYGPEGHRLVRMMQKLGKVDEKILNSATLLNQKDIRTKLAEMQMAGMIEVQCIPRDAAHTVNRSIYLWFFDADRVSTILLGKIYKTMTRCLQRLEIERRRASGILSLAARSDVKNNEADALNGEQLNLLQAFRDKEEMLLGTLNRLDELVGIFRDY